MKSYEEAFKAIDESLDTLGLGQFDLMIIHSPQPWQVVRWLGCGWVDVLE